MLHESLDCSEIKWRSSSFRTRDDHHETSCLVYKKGAECRREREEKEDEGLKGREMTGSSFSSRFVNLLSWVVNRQRREERERPLKGIFYDILMRNTLRATLTITCVAAPAPGHHSIQEAAVTCCRMHQDGHPPPPSRPLLCLWFPTWWCTSQLGRLFFFLFKNFFYHGRRNDDHSLVLIYYPSRHLLQLLPHREEDRTAAKNFFLKETHHRHRLFLQTEIQTTGHSWRSLSCHATKYIIRSFWSGTPSHMPCHGINFIIGHPLFVQTFFLPVHSSYPPPPPPPPLLISGSRLRVFSISFSSFFQIISSSFLRPLFRSL